MRSGRIGALGVSGYGPFGIWSTSRTVTPEQLDRDRDLLMHAAELGVYELRLGWFKRRVWRFTALAND